MLVHLKFYDLVSHKVILSTRQQFSVSVLHVRTGTLLGSLVLLFLYDELFLLVREVQEQVHPCLLGVVTTLVQPRVRAYLVHCWSLGRVVRK